MDEQHNSDNRLYTGGSITLEYINGYPMIVHLVFDDGSKAEYLLNKLIPASAKNTGAVMEKEVKANEELD